MRIIETLDDDQITFDFDGIKIEELPDLEWVVFRRYEDHYTPYIMFTRGRITNHVSYAESETYSYNFNDKSIAVYSSEEEAQRVADSFNQISRQKGYRRYANWQTKPKWWY